MTEKINPFDLYSIAELEKRIDELKNKKIVTLKNIMKDSSPVSFLEGISRMKELDDSIKIVEEIICERLLTGDVE